MENHAKKIKSRVKELDTQRLSPEETLVLVEDVMHEIGKARRQTTLLTQSHHIDHMRMEAIAARSAFETEMAAGYKGAKSGAGVLDTGVEHDFANLPPIWASSTIHEATKEAMQEERQRQQQQGQGQKPVAPVQRPGEARARRGTKRFKAEQSKRQAENASRLAAAREEDPTVQAIRESVGNVEVEKILYTALRNAYFHPDMKNLPPIQQQQLRFRLAEMVLRGFADIEEHPTTFARYFLVFKSFHHIQTGYPFVATPANIRQYFVIDPNTELGRESLTAIQADEELSWQLLPQPDPPASARRKHRSPTPSPEEQGLERNWLLPLTKENTTRIAEFCPHEWTRFAYLTAWNMARDHTNGDDLRSMLDKQINLAHQIATFTQAKTFGNLVLESKQARSPLEARAFLRELSEQVSRLSVPQMQELARLKQAELQNSEFRAGDRAMEDILRWQLTQDPEKLSQIPKFRTVHGEPVAEDPELRARLEREGTVRVFDVTEFSEVRLPVPETEQQQQRGQPVTEEERSMIRNWDLRYYQRLAREEHRKKKAAAAAAETAEEMTPVKTGHVWKLLQNILRRGYGYELVSVQDLVRVSEGETMSSDPAEQNWLKHLATALFAPIQNSLGAATEGGKHDFTRVDWITGMLSRPFYDRIAERKLIGLDYESLPYLHAYLLVDSRSRTALEEEEGSPVKFFETVYRGSHQNIGRRSSPDPPGMILLLSDMESRVGKILPPRPQAFLPPPAAGIRRHHRLQKEVQPKRDPLLRPEDLRGGRPTPGPAGRRRQSRREARRQPQVEVVEERGKTGMMEQENWDLEDEVEGVEETMGASPSVVLLSSDLWWRETGLTRTEIADTLEQFGQVLFSVFGSIPLDYGYLDLAGRVSGVQGDLGFLHPNRIPPELQQLPGMILRHLASDPEVWKQTFLEADGRTPVEFRTGGDSDAAELPPLTRETIETLLTEDDSTWAITALERLVRTRVDLKLWSEVPQTVEDHEPHQMYFQDPSVIPGDIVDRTIHRHLKDLARVTVALPSGDEAEAAGENSGETVQQQKKKKKPRIVCGPALPGFHFGLRPSVQLEDIVSDPCGLLTEWYARVWAGAVWEKLFREDPLNPESHRKFREWMAAIGNAYTEAVPEYTAASLKRSQVSRGLRDAVTSQSQLAYDLTEKHLLDGAAPEFHGLDCLKR